MNEASVKRMIAKSMGDGGGYARRIDDQYSVGMYDMILIPFGLPVFMAEVKIITGNFFGPTPRQHIELMRIAHVAANCGHVIPVMIGYKDGTYYFHKPTLRIDRTACFSVTTSEMPFHDQLTQYYYAQRST